MSRLVKWVILAVAFILNSSLSRSVEFNHWETVVNTEDTWKYFVCDTVPPPLNWRNNDFDDSGWLSGAGGIGYGDHDDATIVPRCWSVLMRMAFTIADTAAIEMLLLEMDFDDSFVAWINGVEIGRFGISGDEPLWNTTLSLDRDALMYQNKDPWWLYHLKDNFRRYLKNGMNVLCIQVNNKDITSSDLTAKAYLFAAVKNDGLTYQPLPQWFKAPESEWKSYLPVFVINTNNQVIADEPKIMAHLGIVQHNNGMPNNPFDEFNSYNGLIGIELRGSSSQIFPKRSYGIETWSTFKTSVSISVLDLPPENDWVLYGPYTDKTLIRNALAYSLFNRFQHYSPRTRFIELFINGEYKGLYLLTEKIKRSTNRVNITKLSEKDLYDMDVTGGYLLKLDKKTGNSSSKGFYSNFLPSAGSQYPYFIYASPSGDEILPEQEEYIQQQLNVFETALNSENYADPQKGYRPFINTNSFVDYFILNELSKNIDGYRLSTYIYKDRDDIDTRFYAGPVWDYDLAFGNANYANASCTSGWQYTIDGEENPIPFWWVRFMSDEYFTGCLKCRWEELRKGILNTDSINHAIDQLVQQIGQAAERNFETYQILGSYIWPNAYNGNTYGEEIDHLKSWILDRSVFLDENMPGDCTATNTEYHRQNGFSVNVYPNPSKDALHIEIDNPAGVQLTLQVVNATGQTVFILRPAKDNLINLSVNLPGGIYQVVVNDNQSHIALKAIVL